MAQKWILTRGEDNIRDLLPGPILPPVIDKELLVDAEKELGLVGAVRRLHAPQVHPDAERLGGLDRWDHVLIAGDEDGLGDRAMPGQCLHVRADLGVHSLLLPARVEVAEPELDPRHLGNHPLVDGRHPVPGRVVPVHPE